VVSVALCALCDRFAFFLAAQSMRFSVDLKRCQLVT
jgi:hypothetical protein